MRIWLQRTSHACPIKLDLTSSKHTLTSFTAPQASNIAWLVYIGDKNNETSIIVSVWLDFFLQFSITEGKKHSVLWQTEIKYSYLCPW